MARTNTQRRLVRGRLGPASKLLIAAAVVELAGLMLPADWSGYFLRIELVASLLAIAGFLVVFFQLRLLDEAMVDSPMRNLLGPRLKANLVLLFVGAFLVPLVNLPIIVWSWFKARAAVRPLDQADAHDAAMAQRRARLFG